MAKYQVTIKYGDQGKPKNSSTILTVSAECEATAMKLAENEFRCKSSSNNNKDVYVVAIKRI